MPLQLTAQKAPVIHAGDEWAYLFWGEGRGVLSGSPLDGCVYVEYAIDMEYIHDTHAVHLMVYHIIWCPRRRRKILHGPVASRLEHIISEVAHEHAWKILQLAIQSDHVHLFIRADPYTLPTDIARLIKGRSSHHMRKEFPSLARMPSLWTRSAFYSTAGNVSSETIQNYIERQSKRD